MPFVEIIEVLALWFCISVPMVFLGAYFGYRKPVEPYPVVTSNIPRQVRFLRFVALGLLSMRLLTFLSV